MTLRTILAVGVPTTTALMMDNKQKPISGGESTNSPTNSNQNAKYVLVDMIGPKVDPNVQPVIEKQIDFPVQSPRTEEQKGQKVPPNGQKLIQPIQTLNATSKYLLFDEEDPVDGGGPPRIVLHKNASKPPERKAEKTQPFGKVGLQNLPVVRYSLYGQGDVPDELVALNVGKVDEATLEQQIAAWLLTCRAVGGKGLTPGDLLEKLRKEITSLRLESKEKDEQLVLEAWETLIKEEKEKDMSLEHAERYISNRHWATETEQGKDHKKMLLPRVFRRVGWIDVTAAARWPFNTEAGKFKFGPWAKYDEQKGYEERPTLQSLEPDAEGKLPNVNVYVLVSPIQPVGFAHTDIIVSSEANPASYYEEQAVSLNFQPTENEKCKPIEGLIDVRGWHPPGIGGPPKRLIRVTQTTVEKVQDALKKLNDKGFYFSQDRPVGDDPRGASDDPRGDSDFAEQFIFPYRSTLGQREGAAVQYFCCCWPCSCLREKSTANCNTFSAQFLRELLGEKEQKKSGEFVQRIHEELPDVQKVNADADSVHRGGERIPVGGGPMWLRWQPRSRRTLTMVV